MIEDDRKQSRQKAPNPVDIEVGARIRTQRRILGMSQSKLAEALGVTFQQVQKYEKGTNRVGASRLQHMATILNVPVSYFFSGEHTSTSDGALPNPGNEITEFLVTTEGLDLNRAFVRISSGLVRKRVVGLVKSLADADTDAAAQGNR